MTVAAVLIVFVSMLAGVAWLVAVIVCWSEGYFVTPMADRGRPLVLNLIITVCFWLPLSLPVLILVVLLRLCLPSRIVNTKQPP